MLVTLDIDVVLMHSDKQNQFLTTFNKWVLAKKVVNFPIVRWSGEFDDPYTTKLLFSSHVLPNLEYNSSVWSAQHQGHIASFESVQKQGRTL